MQLHKRKRIDIYIVCAGNENTFYLIANKTMENVLEMQDTNTVETHFQNSFHCFVCYQIENIFILPSHFSQFLHF